MGRAVFLDRDGTLIEDKDYLADPGGVELVPGAAGAVRAFQDLGFLVVLVTNQSGIGRGYFTVEDYQAVHAELVEQLARAGVALDGAYYCPDAPGGEPGHTCRKPALAMYETASAELGIETTRSYYVGDKASDVAPAEELGGVGILVRTGQGRQSEGEVGEIHHVVDDLPAALALIEGLEGAESSR